MSFWLELNLNPDEYWNANELASTIATLIKKDGIPVYVYTDYASVQKFSTNPFMCKEFHFDCTELISAIIKTGLRITLDDHDMFKIAVKEEDICKYSWNGYGVPPGVQ